ncbi:PAS domain S-box-containing protein [Novosphingobium kunmingense]|uniref:histidine kinase n=1 Tax=Novosphingobium kunmingense TaxID=1211806 RepID=A0A2N0I3Y0_9SPHN|nr:PAS domain S-box protein [Novosphingobium kunmingense]PKB25873.1 PAS domain S-box-containing protein [Novosphingobium kunmingense]
MAAPSEPINLFEAIVNSSDAAVISKSLDSVVLSWNPTAEALFGWTPEEIIGQSVRRIIPDDLQQEEDFILDRIRHGESATRLETVRIHKDGTRKNVAMLVSPIRDRSGTIIGASSIMRDLTAELRTREALDDIEQRFSLMADNISQLAWITDPTGWIFWYNKRWFDYTGTSLEEMQGWGWQAVHHPDHVDRVTRHFSECINRGVEWEDTFPLRGADGVYRWFLSRAVPLRDAEGKILYWFGSNTDVTDLRDAERRIELLLMEVNHRSKNLLTVVQSLARRTAAASPDTFVERLEQRIASLAANQDVLVQRNWSAVPLRELVEAQLSYLAETSRQVVMDGPDVVVLPSAAEAVSMALHELATNAEKYGALSVPGGRVNVSWAISGERDDSLFTLTWVESGGPPARAPGRRGFGSRIIEEVPRGKLRAEVSIEYPPEGCRFMLRCPPQNVLALA